jgi:RNA polymerase sigma-70 factor (ECF subfamily)
MAKKSQLQELGMAFYQTRSEADFNKVYLRMKSSVGYYIKDILPASADRDEALANTFAKVWSKIHMYDPYWNFSTWVYRIARNEALLMLRYKRRNYSLEAMEEKGVNMESRTAVEMPNLELNNSELPIIDVLFEHAVDAISKLPETYKVVMTMREIEKKKYEDISKELGWKQNTVRTRIRKGRELLRKDLLSNHPELVRQYSEQMLEK